MPESGIKKLSPRESAEEEADNAADYNSLQPEALRYPQRAIATRAEPNRKPVNWGRNVR
jgi:hypothetical protein